MRILWRSISALFVLTLLTAALMYSAIAQQPPQNAVVDSDCDGISDALEQSLLLQFAPTFTVARHDCSKLPAEFTPNLETPTPEVEDGTIYGQVFPAKSATGDLPTAEIHFYHLWRRDCGPHGHPLDTEHVAVLVTSSDRDLATAKWKALYWYAAAHEETVCDVSQITRASTLHAEQSGATVFVSPGKHASYFSEKLCRSGCGADRCIDEVALSHGGIINLGEPGHPMNGSVGPPQPTSGNRHRMVQPRQAPSPGNHRQQQHHKAGNRNRRQQHNLFPRDSWKIYRRSSISGAE
jgi:hypothetical protein